MLLSDLYRNLNFHGNQLFTAFVCLLLSACAYLKFLSSKRNKQNDTTMPQVMNVLSCYKCNMYQVHIAKKSNKWQCKICGEKQSISIVYFQGSGSDCRKEVQHLNYLKSADQASFRSTSIEAYGLDCDGDSDDSDKIDPCNCRRSTGKWAKYLESDEEDSSCDCSDEKENFSSQEDAKNPRKKIKKERASYSQPPTSMPSKMECDSGETPYESPAESFRSLTYPLVDNSQRIRGKWDKYLEGEKEASGSRAKISQNVVLAEDSISSPSCSVNVFDDSNEDLDVNVDF